MIPTKENITKAQSKRRKKLKPKVHSKISNTFIENAINKSNFSTLKTLYYLSTILSAVDMKNMEDDKIVGIKIDKREMLKFTDLTAGTIIKTTKQMQQTAITFVDDDGTIEGTTATLDGNKIYIELAEPGDYEEVREILRDRYGK